MENTNLTHELSEKVKAIISGFLDSQLGEKANTINSFLNNDILAIYAHDILSPAEKQMLQSESECKMIMEYKNQQFESVKSELINEMEKKTGLIIKNVQTIITKDGIRIINITIENQNQKNIGA